jgi:hypothetical protein
MSRYLFISLSIVFLFFARGEAQEQEQRTIRQALALGVDLSPFVVRIFDHDRTGLAFTGRYTIKEKWFVAGEAGFENVSFEKREFDYESNGTFIRLGLDHNIFKVDEIGNNDNILIGFRYGFAWQEQTNNRFTITDGYWGDYQGSAGTSQVNSHWLELVAGVRSEIFKNFYMGWTIRLRKLILSDYPGVLAPYSMPGYGQYDNKTNLGFTYTLEYQIPTVKSKKQKP